MHRFARVVGRRCALSLTRWTTARQASTLVSTVGRGRVLASITTAQPFSKAPMQHRSFSTDGETITMKTPDLGDSIEEGTILEWHHKVGDWVRKDDVIVTLETDKVAVEIRAEAAGQISQLHAEEDDSVEVGANLVDLTLGEPPEGYAQEEETAAPAPSVEETAAPPPPPAAPAAEKQAAPTPTPQPAAPAADASVDISDTVLASGRVEERVKMSRMRKTIAANLKNAQNTAAMLTTFNEVDMSALIDLRKKHKDEFEAKHGQKLGFMSPFMKACGLALQEVPAVNSQLDDNENIVYRNYSDISVAVATPTGLVMPVIRNCESAPLARLESDLGDLAARARTRQISMEEMQGGTFSISNGGVFGSLMGTPILFAPQTAILGMHATKMRAVVDPATGEVVAKPMMYLALTYDHRLIDGREAVTFLCSVRDKIEDPHRMLLGL